MTGQQLKWVAAWPLALLGAGCHGGSFAINYHDHHPAPVEYVRHSHVCSRACHDHYYDGTRVIVLGGGHRHGPGCGHFWDGRYWVIVKRSDPHTHVCTRNCHHHYYDGHKLVILDGGHRHGPHCGHHWDGKFWVEVRKSRPHRRSSHVCTPQCHHHYYDGGKLVVIGGRHRHGPDCGHHWNGTYWVVARERSRPHVAPEPRKDRPRKQIRRR